MREDKKEKEGNAVSFKALIWKQVWFACLPFNVPMNYQSPACRADNRLLQNLNSKFSHIFGFTPI